MRTILTICVLSILLSGCSAPTQQVVESQKEPEDSPKEAEEVVAFRKDVANFAKETRLAVKLLSSGTTQKAATEKYEYIVDLASRIDLPNELTSPEGLDVRPRLLLISSEIAETKMWFTLPLKSYNVPGMDHKTSYDNILRCSAAVDTHLKNLYAPLTDDEQADVAGLLKQ